MNTRGTIVLLMLLLLIGLPTTSNAAWSGANTTCPSNQGGLAASCETYVEGCQSWANFYNPNAPVVKSMTPHASGYTCRVAYLNVTDAWVPTLAFCEPGETVNIHLPSGCQKHTGGHCPSCENGQPSAGNPIAIGNGNKFDQVTDFETAGPDSLRFVRSYNSYERSEQPLGLGWRSNFDRVLTFPSASTTNAYRADGQKIVFTLSGGIWSTNTDTTEQLTKTGTIWTLTDRQDRAETYDGTGKLTTITARNGYQHILEYDMNDQLTTVIDTHGRQLTFTYDGPRLATMTDPDGQLYTYTYRKIYAPLPDRNLLISVTYPNETPNDPFDNPSMTYLYENTDFPYGLTGILDENGDRYATYAYDDEGRGILSEHAGGADRVTIAYNSDLQRTVTNALGQITVYDFAWVQGVRKVIQESRHATATVPAATQTRTYDTDGFTASRTDWQGIPTTFTNNARGLQTSRTEASGTSEARTITTTWHPTFRVPTHIVEPGKATDFTYDSNGKLLSKIETDSTGGSTNGQTRTWTYTYTITGLLHTIDGPRTAVTDVTTNTYTMEGYLNTVTNAIGHVTEITSHNARGLPLIMKDANAVETHLTYHPRGWLASSTIKSASGDATTQFEYDHRGQVTSITRPDGSELHYEYDAAHRVTAISNGLGERIDYTLDAEGNRATETVKSASGTIIRTQTRTFDSLSRLLTHVGASSQTTTTAYDANGNTISITDPLTNATQQAFDALNRLVKVTDPLSGEAEYAYNGQGQLTSVTDQRHLTTTYTYNGFGDVIQLNSPDTGTTTYIVDVAGNRTQQTDARGIVTNYSYDAVNRITSMQFPANSAENVIYSYDDQTSGNSGKGRLTSLTDQSGTTSYVYDDRGNVLTDTRVMGTHTYHTHYQYDMADNLTQVTYPSGRVVTYQRDVQGRVASVATQLTATSAPAMLASAMTYEPFGPLTSLTYGNGLALDLSYDQDYRLTGITTDDGSTVIQNLAYTHDAADNITAITDALTTARTQTFGYDALHRLTTATGLYGTLGYTYDAVGNRLSRTQGGTTETFTYDTVSNRLLSATTGSSTRSFGYTANGQTTTDNRGAGDVYGLLYNHQNRLNEVKKNSVSDTMYTYNALGQRVLKDTVSLSTPDIHFLYDRDGRLLAESSTEGVTTREYIHVDGLPLAVIDVGGSGGTPTTDLILDNTDAAVTTTGTWSSATTVAGYEGSDYLEHAQSGIPAGGELIDNDSVGFSTMGTWTLSTDRPGYAGLNYLRRLPVDATLNPIVIDNTDAAFSSVGTWTFSSNVSGYYGLNYQWHWENAVSPDAVVIDNGGPGFTSTGTWTLSTNVSGYQGANYQWYPGLEATNQLLDNDGPEFSATGSWTLSTNVSGYQGASYQWHPTGVLPPSAIIIDNTDANTTAVGSWNVYTNISGYWGANYGWHAPASNTSFTWTPTIPTTKQYKVYARWQAWQTRATNATYTIHHASGTTTVVKNHKVDGSQWNLLGTVTMAPNSNHRVVLEGTGNGSLTSDAVAFVAEDALPHLATWMPTITATQEYEVYATWQSTAYRATDATYLIHHAEGTTDVIVDQTKKGSQWNYLGTFIMEPNEDHRIELRTDGNGTIIADAVLLTPAGTPTGTATWTPTLTTTTQYAIYATWQSTASRATSALYTLHHAGGTSTVAADQTVNSNQWNLLGTVTMAPGQNHRVVLTESVTGTTIADAVQFVPFNGARNRASWTPSVLAHEDYEVYARWAASSGRASNAPYTIEHAGGRTTIIQNQKLNGGQWNLLGNFVFRPNSGHHVSLTDDANDTVIADAVKWVPSTIPRVATWTPTITSSEDYQIYTRWTSHANRATNATYTVHHAGGSTPVVVNQQADGGQWQLLGTFSLAAGQNHRVELTAQANGTVVADAVYVVPASTATNAVTWTPTLTTTETLDIYAKWTSDADRADDVTYTVHHAGGSTPIVVNQRQNGGTWHHLGQFSMAPSSNHSVVVADSATGVVVADAVRFVSAGTGGGTGFLYVHADHLGTPQKMTDGTQAVVWDAVYKPFGETQSITGTASNNQRFPGQYADVEAGFSYNYFRDYDPTTGRYVESDPIGLKGGVNTYLYTNVNPLKFIDPLGLNVGCGFYETRCEEVGGIYYCYVAPVPCDYWPDGLKPPGSDKDWVECSRKCLQRKDQECNSFQCSDEGADISCITRIHVECWWECY